MPSVKDYDKILEGMWAATEKSHYNPKTDTNWCHLPMEMRIECIKKMSLMTRMRLRRTSKTEKLLVESKKYHLDCFECSVYDDKWFEIKTIIGDSYERNEKQVHDYQNLMRSFANILKYYEVDTLVVLTEKENEKALEQQCTMLPRDVPFRFKNFKSDCNNAQILKFFLGKCEGVEQVQLNNRCRTENVLYLLVELPSVINAKLFKIFFLPNTDCALFELVKKWIDNDAEIEKKMRFALFDKKDEDEPIELFASIFEDRVISKDDENARIRTDNSTKHIYLRCDASYRKTFYYTCTIIPSDLLELPEDCEWAKQIHSDVLGEVVVEDLYEERINWDLF